MKHNKRIQKWMRYFLSICMVGLLCVTAHAGCNTNIGDKVWNDLNGNGIQEDDEPGINGVTVTLKNLDTGEIETTKTRDSGNYYFKDNCNDISYQIIVDESTLPPEINTASPCHNESGTEFDKDSNCNGQKILLGFNEVNQSLDFGYYSNQVVCVGSIGDYIWNDANHDGIQQASEQGINDISVVVKESNGSEYFSVTSTGGPLNKPGFYEVADLCKGNYTVSVHMDTVPVDMVTTLIQQGGNAAKDSNDPAGTSVTLNDDELNVNIDFGFFTPCSGEIGDYVWNDSDRNGLQSVTEQGINGIKISVTDSNNNVNTVDTFTGGPLSVPGYYIVNGLCAGTYTVTVDETSVPSGLNPTVLEAGNNGDIDSNNPAGTQVVLAEDNSKDATIDFGYQTSCTGSIGDYLWNDADRDGIQDDNELGMNGVTIKLTDVDGNVQEASTYTGGPGNAPGYYVFNGLCKGQYTLHVVAISVPAGMQPTIIGAGNDQNLDSNDPAGTIVNLAADSSLDTSADFGYQTPCSGRIGDYVWNDENNDGIQQNDEDGINGVEIRATGNDGSQHTVTTFKGGPRNVPGYYLIEGLCAGTYDVEVNSVTVPADMEPTLVGGGNDSNLDSNDSTGTSVTLGENGKDFSIDFGFAKPADLVCGLNVKKTASKTIIECINNGWNSNNCSKHHCSLGGCNNCNTNCNTNCNNNGSNNGNVSCPDNQKITYTYTITNTGDKIVLTGVNDDKIGSLLGYIPKPSLVSGESITFTVEQCLTKTTTNTVVVTGSVDDGKSCSAQDSVTVEVKPAPEKPHTCGCWSFLTTGFCSHIKPKPHTCGCWSFLTTGHCSHIKPKPHTCGCWSFLTTGHCSHIKPKPKTCGCWSFLTTGHCSHVKPKPKTCGCWSFLTTGHCSHVKPKPKTCGCWSFLTTGHCKHVSSHHSSLCNCWSYKHYGHCSHVDNNHNKPKKCNCWINKHFGSCNHKP